MKIFLSLVRDDFDVTFVVILIDMISIFKKLKGRHSLYEIAANWIGMFQLFLLVRISYQYENLFVAIYPFPI